MLPQQKLLIGEVTLICRLTTKLSGGRRERCPRYRIDRQHSFAPRPGTEPSPAMALYTNPSILRDPQAEALARPLQRKLGPTKVQK